MKPRAYYNENDKFAAAWLRELIKAGHIAPGEVDERSIVDVNARDLEGFTQCHFFGGIGGWSYALRLAGWPDDRPVWTGSCPCQPFSSAGKGKGGTDDRHLWPYWFRLIRECRPDALFGEQVESAIAHGWLDAVCDDLEGDGYAIGAACLPACSVGAPHARQRLWFAANANGSRLPQWKNDTKHDSQALKTSSWRELERVHAAEDWARWDSESHVRVFAHGLPGVGGRLRGFGNAIVPQVAAEFIAAYMDITQEVAA